MHLPSLLARHLREVYFGKNWTWVHLKETLEGVTLEEAMAPVPSGNNILALTYHIQYFLRAQMEVLKGNPLDAKDALSFDHPVLPSEAAWQTFLNTLWQEAEAYAQLVEQLPESRLFETFVEEKYGTYYRNIQGLIEHTHYHLGQIVLLLKGRQSRPASP